jgi:epoxyqueuosine reductase
MAFFSDLPCEDDVWFESSMMKECQKCTACIRACPTGAITSERFLIRAERCLTFQNERSGEFPSWVDPSWHHCLFGCMGCQKICPQNKRMLNWIEDRGEFTEQETSLILEKVPLNRIPSSTRKKIERLYMIDEYELLSRNLNSVLMNSLFDKREE